MEFEPGARVTLLDMARLERELDKLTGFKVDLPTDRIVTILRDGQVYTPDAEQPLEAGDELLFVVPAEVETELEQLLSPGHV